MKRPYRGTIALVTALACELGVSTTSAQDKYTLKVPGGLAFSEFRGYQGWHLVSISQDGPFGCDRRQSHDDRGLQGRHPGNGKPFPDGSKVKASKRFADSRGWGYAVFEYDAATKKFRPGTKADTPPQANDAKCGFACHTILKTRDYVFTDYSSR